MSPLRSTSSTTGAGPTGGPPAAPSAGPEPDPALLVTRDPDLEDVFLNLTAAA